MRRRTYVLLALLLFAIVLASSASAVPTLVQLTIKDPVMATDNAAPTGDNSVSLPGNGGTKGKSNDKGKGGDKGNSSSPGNSGNAGNSGNSNGKADLKALTLWLSTDGKSWKAVSSDVVDLTSNEITARLGTKASGTTTDLMKSFGAPSTNITGDSQQSFFVGLSTSSTSYTGGYFTARLVSWNYVMPNGRAVTTIAVPEPSMLPLFATGAIGLGLLVGGRKKR